MKKHSAKIQAWRDMADEKRETRVSRKLVLPRFEPKILPALSKAKRQAIVEKVAVKMQDWRASPFQNEASFRHGLRAGLCLVGFSWHRSDLEASVIVSASLNKIGAVRPTWAEGQCEYLGAYDNCVHCGHELSNDQIVHGDRFCDLDCVKAHRLSTGNQDLTRYRELAKSATRIITISKRKKQICEQCGNSFVKRGNTDNGRYCTVKCAGEAKRTRPDLVCENSDCGTIFKANAQWKNSTHHYCSAACAHSDRDRWAPTYECECALCGKSFQAKFKQAKFCSKSCNARHYQYRSGRVVPTRITPVVFDFFFILLDPANVAEPGLNLDEVR
ncbi:hypothetical protein PSQ90_07705 [Devosia rhodophyticola]|uniref:Uncharacterized protein n=1 Tax=Devosia rhodophyticola TaxID=3026423 RepID=A0ABY7Z0X6_9HYPH|nr:hypothetical protein [Devosia rhodophyticola]WDR07293.1 hypothetical protein PSQ90_07705 [Devosia rhodophyticola]